MAASSLVACQLASPDGDPSAPHTSNAAAALSDPATCAWSPTVAVTPSTIPATPTGVPVTLDVAVTNAAPAGCDPMSFELDITDTGLLFDPRPRPTVAIIRSDGSNTIPPAPVLSLAGGQTGHITVTATAPASADPGDVLPVRFVVSQPVTLPDGDEPPPPPPRVSVPDLSFTVARTPGCQVSTSHELMITDLSVVDDPVRTTFDPSSRDPRNGAWSFKRLMENMARTPADAPAMVEAMLRSLTTSQTINGFTVAARPGIQSQVLDAWPRTADGALDLAKAPLHLLAIVNRIDLRNLGRGDAGEGRFVFSFDLPPSTPPAPPAQATIILEYKLPASRELDVLAWAASFHALGKLPFGELYNLALQGITDRFTRRGARPDHPDGSAINAVRTNEIPFGDNGLWELREFHLSAASGRLEPATVDLTPDLALNNTTTLADYINANQADIIAEKFSVPETFQGQAFLGGAIFNDLTTWFAPGVDGEARHHFALNTCNGCHGFQETATPFLHLSPRTTGTATNRSRFLTGTFVKDPATGKERLFDDLGRRKADLKSLICFDPATLPSSLVQNGIRRVH